MNIEKKRERSPLHQALESTYASTQMDVAAQTEKLAKFHGQQGHGFAAEQANTMIDKIHGRNAIIVGDDNAKNGADRLVDGQLIQTKYCNNAKASINAGFGHDGNYKYIDSNGNPMQIEVASDQYEEAVRLMEEKIRNGKVPGVKDPKKAKELVRKGNVTYRQAVNIAKAGTVESLLFDAANGVVIGAGALGVSASIVFAKALWEGDDPRDALDKGICAGIQAGGTGFLTEVVTAQLMRTGLVNSLKDVSVAIVKALPSKVRHWLVNTFRDGAKIFGGAATNNLAKLLRTNFVAGVIIITIASGPQIIDAIRGRVSSGQLFKGIAITASGVGGGTLGATIGTAIGGPVGTFLGGIIGGFLAGAGSQKLLDKWIKNDADGLIPILEQELIILAEEYLLSEEEVEIVLDEFSYKMTIDFLKDMYAANNRNRFARNLLEPIVVNLISHRAQVYMPSEAMLMDRIETIIEALESGRDMSYLTKTKEVDAVEVCQALFGKKVSKGTASRVVYMMKQTNMPQQQAEIVLMNMMADEQRYKEEMGRSQANIDHYKEELVKLFQ